MLFVGGVWFKESVLGLLPIVVPGKRGVVEVSEASRLAMAVLLRKPETFVIHREGRTLEHFLLVEIEVAAKVTVPFLYGAPVWVPTGIG